MPSLSPSPEIVIAGAGIIGLSLALELHTRGARVTVLERDTALAHASIAAAGMLAAEDAHMPAALRPLARYSVEIYPAFLARIEALSNISVPFQTSTTIEYLADNKQRSLAENSIDPRQLAVALLAAVRATSIDLREHTDFATHTKSAAIFIQATGAWPSDLAPQVFPLKGQMLRIALPASLALDEVHRRGDVYIAPRKRGPQAGSALIGATIENAGFDTTIHEEDLAHLRTLAAELIPALADEAAAPQLEAWAGLRPATPDGLPLIGQITKTNFMATGHFRDGILLAPATAVVLAGVIEGRAPAVDLAAFDPKRFR